MTAPKRAPTNERLQARISAADLARIKEAHAVRYAEHRLAFSPWIVRVLLAKADQTLCKPT